MNFYIPNVIGKCFRAFPKIIANKFYNILLLAFNLFKYKFEIEN